jgi:hypothetical protein
MRSEPSFLPVGIVLVHRNDFRRGEFPSRKDSRGGHAAVRLAVWWEVPEVAAGGVGGFSADLALELRAAEPEEDQDVLARLAAAVPGGR